MYKDEIANLISAPNIQGRVGEIEEVLIRIEALGDDELLQECVNLIKDGVQKEAEKAILRAPGQRGILALCTGSGKSKIPINAITKQLAKGRFLHGVLIVPTQKLRDSNWKEEFEKWGLLSHYDSDNLERYCYASVPKIKGRSYDYAILDEGHNITPNSAKFLEQNRINVIFMLTATPPTDPEKLKILSSHGLEIVYSIDIDTAVRLRIVAPYDLTIIECDLDKKKRYIQAGSKKNGYFMVTEYEQYGFLTQSLQKAFSSKKKFRIDMAINARMWFIYRLESKTNFAKFILESQISKEERTLIFCGSIEQAIELCPYRYFSKPTVSKKDKPEKQVKSQLLLDAWEGDKWLEAFQRQEINKLACIRALNEGNNIKNLDSGLGVQLNGIERDFLQRLGRELRYRIGHVGKFYVMCTVNTQDEVWVKEAISSLNPSKIKYVRMINLLSGNERLT